MKTQTRTLRCVGLGQNVRPQDHKSLAMFDDYLWNGCVLARLVDDAFGDYTLHVGDDSNPRTEEPIIDQPVLNGRGILKTAHWCFT